MKKGWVITGFLAIVLAGAGIGGAISYGSDDTLPEGFSIGGLQLGGEVPDAHCGKFRSALPDWKPPRSISSLTALAIPPSRKERLRPYP
ncbi:hypothetical protein [Cohnella cholangitidis]|uniref:Uncharacterized protein n=1 Tax=Cohnella cholangitidis TaxID=2598458 RepID=A0A7G5BXF5_9BACL|nr:hypothetical protein [Cohnella cholangitidis]QMV41639.1 hypothetical protein FPL14_10940 [Cohnella cholangitidis]